MAKEEKTYTGVSKKMKGILEHTLKDKSRVELFFWLWNKGKKILSILNDLQKFLKSLIYNSLLLIESC